MVLARRWFPHIPSWISRSTYVAQVATQEGGELGLFAEFNFNLRPSYCYLSVWCFMICNKTMWMCPSKNVKKVQHNHRKAITNTKIYSGSEHSWLLHPLPKISLEISTIFTPEYSRVVLHRDHNSNPLGFHRLTKNLGGFTGKSSNLLGFHRLTKNLGGFTGRSTNLSWFSQAHQEPKWFYRITHQPI